MSDRGKFKMALAMINLLVAWIAAAFLPRVSLSYSYQSAAEKAFKKFIFSFDWPMIFKIVGISVFVTVSVWLILSSYGKLPSEKIHGLLDDNDAV